MKIFVQQERLAKALGAVSRVTGTRAELPVLNNILFRVDEGRLLIAATNLDISATQYIGAKVEKPGAITVPPRLITDFIANLPSGTVELEVKDDHLHITSGLFSSVINGVVADEFPELPTVDGDDTITMTMQAGEFKKAVSQTIIAVGSDMARPTLTGVYWHTFNGHLYLSATSGLIIAEKRMMKLKDELSAIITKATLQEVIYNLTDDNEDISIIFADTQVCFRTEDTEIISQLIDGKFVDYRAVLTDDNDVVATIDRSDFKRVTKIAGLFAHDVHTGVTMEISEENQTVSVRSIASELGENTSVASATVSGEGTISVNSRRVLECLDKLDDAKIRFLFNSEKVSLCIIQEDSDDPQHRYVVLPLSK